MTSTQASENDLISKLSQIDPESLKELVAKLDQVSADKDAATDTAKDEVPAKTDDKAKPRKKSAQEVQTSIVTRIINDLMVTKYAGMLWFFSKDVGWYVHDDDALRRHVYTYDPEAKTKDVDELIKQMDYRLEPVDDQTVFGVRLKNGVLINGQFIKTDSKAFTPYFIDVAYDDKAKPVKVVDEYLDHLASADKAGKQTDQGYRKLIEEMLGYTLFTDPEKIRVITKFFILVGDGQNGKGTLLTVIGKILGKQNCSGLSLDQMGQESYANQMVGKLVNLGDDIQDRPIDEGKMKMLKNISSADSISIRRLYHDATSATIDATLIFTSNAILSSFEKGWAYKRRVLWLPMYYRPAKPDPTIVTKLTAPDAMAYWLKLIVDGYKRLYQTMSFTDSKTVDGFNKTYHETNNSVLEWLSTVDADRDIVAHKIPQVQATYAFWCKDNGLKVQSARVIKNTIKEQFDIEAVPVKTKARYGSKWYSFRAYVRIDDNGDPVPFTLPQKQTLAEAADWHPSDDQSQLSNSTMRARNLFNE